MKPLQYYANINFLLLTLLILCFSSNLYASSIEEDDDVIEKVTHFQKLNPENLLNLSSLNLKMTDEMNEEEAGKYSESLGTTNCLFPQKYQFINPELEIYFSVYKLPTVSPSASILGNLSYDTYLKTKSLDFLNKAAGNYHAAALLELAERLRATSQKDALTTAAKFIHLSGTQGYPPALYELAESYEFSPGRYGFSSKNSQLAKLLCEEAANLGNEEAQCMLANAYLEGTFNTEINPLLGFQKLDELALKGNQQALNIIKSIIKTPDEAFFEARGYVKPDFQWKSSISDISF